MPDKSKSLVDKPVGVEESGNVTDCRVRSNLYSGKRGVGSKTML